MTQHCQKGENWTLFSNSLLTSCRSEWPTWHQDLPQGKTHQHPCPFCTNPWCDLQTGISELLLFLHRRLLAQWRKLESSYMWFPPSPIFRQLWYLPKLLRSIDDEISRISQNECFPGPFLHGSDKMKHYTYLDKDSRLINSSFLVQLLMQIGIIVVSW